MNRKRTNSTKKPEQNTTTNKSTPDSVSTTGSAIIVGDYMVKHWQIPELQRKIVSRSKQVREQQLKILLITTRYSKEIGFFCLFIKEQIT